MKLMNLETLEGTLSESDYKSYMNEYHHHRIEKEILLGNLPRHDKVKSKYDEFGHRKGPKSKKPKN